MNNIKTLILRFNDPRYVCIRDIDLLLNTGGIVSFSEGEPLSLTKSDNGSVFLGDGDESVRISRPSDLSKIIDSIRLCKTKIEEVDGELIFYPEDELVESDIVSSIPISSIVKNTEESIKVIQVNFV